MGDELRTRLDELQVSLIQ